MTEAPKKRRSDAELMTMKLNHLRLALLSLSLAAFLFDLFLCYIYYASTTQNAFITANENLSEPNDALPGILPRFHTCRINSNNETVTIPMVPTFIIAGAQKGGTSALYTLLKMHPSILASRRNELHFFDGRGKIPSSNASELSEDDLCRARKKYSKFFDLDRILHSPSGHAVASFEKTPKYLIMPSVPALIHAVCLWKPKILVMLRNPIDRAYSLYKMNKGKNKNYPSFEEIVEAELAEMKKAKLTTAPSLSAFLNNSATIRKPANHDPFPIPNNLTYQQRNQVAWYKIRVSMTYRGLYAQHLANWLPYFPLGTHLKVIQYEAFQQNMSGIFNEILDFVGAPRHNFTDEVFKTDYSPHHGFRARNVTLRLETRVYLQRFYKLYNEELADLLGEEWRGIWDF